jgi:hypothetical protein
MARIVTASPRVRTRPLASIGGIHERPTTEAGLGINTNNGRVTYTASVP